MEGSMLTPPDHETIAAFLEGKLDSEERERIVNWLAGSEEARSMLAEMATTLDEVANPSESAVHQSQSSQKRPFRWWWVPLAAAAILVLLLLPVRNASVVGPGEAGSEILAILALVEPPTGSGGVDASWGSGALDPPWSSVRGPSTQPVLGTRRTAFRLGLLIGLLDFGGRAQDGAFLSRVGDDLQATLLSVDNSEALSARATQILGGAPDGGAWRALGDQLRARTSPQWFDLGAWAGAIQIGSAAGQEQALASLGQLGESISVLGAPQVTSAIADLTTGLAEGIERTQLEVRLEALVSAVERLS